MPAEKKPLFSAKDVKTVYVNPDTGEREIKVLNVTDGTVETTFRGYICKRVPRYGETELPEHLAKPFLSSQLPTHHHLPDVQKIGVEPDPDDVFVTYLIYGKDEQGRENTTQQRATHPQFAQLLKQKRYVTAQQWRDQIELAGSVALKHTLGDRPTSEQAKP